MLFGPPKSVPELVVENMPPPMLMDLNGTGTSSWERVLSGLLLSSDALVLELVLRGIVAIRSGTSFCKFCGMPFVNPCWFTRLFSSVNASQNALCVMKLSLLHDSEEMC